MTTPRFALALTIFLPTLSAAQDLSPAIRLSAACAPVGRAMPSDAPRIGATGPQQKTLYNVGEQVAIDAGADHGLQAGERYFVRRAMASRGGPGVEQTVGWLRVSDTRESTATGTIEFTCDAVAVGDHLEPYADPVLPSDLDRTDASGTLDPSRSVSVLYGNEGRELGGDRDFMLADAGEDQGITPGARYAVYRGSSRRGEFPQDAFGEAVVVSVFADKAVLRITEAGDAVRSGDTLVLRVGGAGFAGDASGTAAAPEPPAQAVAAEAPRVASGSVQTAHPTRTFEFEDLLFDFDRHTLKDQSVTLLDQALQALQDDPGLRLLIEGHSCNIGPAKYNLALGERRAKVVFDYLTSHGVTANRLTTVSYGEERPKYDNKSRETRKLNRRATLVVDHEVVSQLRK
jgi:outer membrane protein OmpA-like peptidoglycan-associated protein